MLILRSSGAVVALSTSFLLCSCFTNKNKDVVDAPPPPPSAYPDTSANLGGTAGPVPSVPSASNAAVAATNSGASPSAPAPFSLREGEQLVNHQIQPGESLSSIAAKYNSSVSRIQSANGISGTKIIAGKTLQVPTSAPPMNLAGGASAPMAPTPAPSASPYPAAGGSYPAASGASPYPGTLSAPSSPVIPPTTPSAPSFPSTSGGAGAIAAPPVPSTGGTTLPGYPSSTSIPRTQTAPSYPTPSFEASRIQFSN